jgi:hypothetical protein
MPRDIAEAARARSGPSGLSAYVAAAPVTVLTSDPEDISALCGTSITVIKI